MTLEELLLAVDGLERDVAIDWLATRKSKRAGLVTSSILKSMQREANKIGWSLADAITHSAENGWIVFKSDWIRESRIGFIEKHADTSWADSVIEVQRYEH